MKYKGAMVRLNILIPREYSEWLKATDHGASEWVREAVERKWHEQGKPTLDRRGNHPPGGS